MFSASTFRFPTLALLLGAAALSAQIPGGIVLRAAFNSGGTGAFGILAGMEEIPGKPGHFLVVEMKGTITLLAPGAAGHSRSPFATIPINTTHEDQGLSPIAFHPNFAVNGKFYYRLGDTAVFPRGIRIMEGEAAADALKDSGKPHRTLLTVTMPGEFDDHNGGGIGFGKDGYLYLGIGDGGWDLMSPDVHNNGQNRESLLGKILRIDVDRRDPGLEYAIPADNPFVNDPNVMVRREIYAYGLRNPYRMSFDRITGELYVADVGLYNYEKVYILRKGANYGWKLQEHTHCYTPGTCDAITVDPPAGYLGYGPVKCFIGGHVYRGDPESPFFGVYLFGDHTNRRLLAFKKGSAPVAVTDLQYSIEEMTGFTLDSRNNLYMIGYRGTIYKLDHEDLPAQHTALRPRARLALGSSGKVRAGARLHRLDGSFLGLAPADGRLPDAAGLIVAAPSR